MLIQSGQLFGITPQQAAGLIPDDSLAIRALMILTLTAGTAFIMWLGELITQRGIGNGMSLIIFTAIVAQPAGHRDAHLPDRRPRLFASCSSSWRCLLIVGVVFVEQGQRRIPVQYAKRQVGRRTLRRQPRPTSP